jgi:hypothetical protein
VAIPGRASRPEPEPGVETTRVFDHLADAA